MRLLLECFGNFSIHVENGYRANGVKACKIWNSMVWGSAPKLYLKVPIHLPFYLFSVILNKTILITIGTTGSPSLVVMGGDSCSKGCGFKFQRHILDGHFSLLFVVKL